MRTKFLVLLLCCFYCVSCSDDMKPKMKESLEIEASYSKLNETLSAYNQDFIASHPTVPTTRGFWKWFKAVLFCDATGALIGSSLGTGGAIVGGIIFSALGGGCAYSVPTSKPSTECAIVNSIPLLDEQCDSVGFIHNSILLEIAEENEGIFEKNVTAKQWIELVIPKAEKYGYFLSADEKKMITNDVVTLQPTAEVMCSEEQLVAHYKAICPEYSNQIEIVQNYISTASLITDKETLNEYTQGYAKIITQTKLPKHEQQALVSSIVVAENSSMLWVDPVSEDIALKP